MLHPKTLTTILRRLSTTATATATATATKPSKLHPLLLSKIPSKYRPRALNQAQQALTDYLHATRSLPFTYADLISKHSLFSISNLISHLDFSATHFHKTLRRFIRYNPINEFEFFFESIGINYDNVCDFLPNNKFFFSEDGRVLSAACALWEFGFPWNRLGVLYKEEVEIFAKDSDGLTARLCGFKDCYGFSNVMVISVCLAFPFVLNGKAELEGEIGALFDNLKRIFVDSDLGGCVEGNVDAWYEVCRKIRVFYNLCCEKGRVGELIGRSKNVFLQYSEEVLVQKVDYFCRFGVKTKDVGLLILWNPEILGFDLETPVFSVVGLLKHFGLSSKELDYVVQKYPYVLGRNRMANLPNVMRALDLHEWFFNKIKNGNYQLLGNYVIGNSDEDLDKEFIDGLERIQSLRTHIHTMSKLNFLNGIGFGENGLTLKVLTHVHGTSCELQERFDCLLRVGIEFSKLCMMMRTTPKIMNQSPEATKQKVNFLCQEMGSSLQLLDGFPAYLCFDLENRIKPRYRFHVWLMGKDLCTKNYSIASIVATSEKNFVARLFGIHPAAPKQWFEFCKKSSSTCEEALVS